MSRGVGYNLKSLLLVRILRALFGWTVVLGKFEYNLFYKIIGRTPKARPMRMPKVRRRHSFAWLTVFLIVVGRVVSSAVVWPFKQIWKVLRFIALSIVWLFKFVGKILFVWPWQAVSNVTRVVSRSIFGVGRQAVKAVGALPQQAVEEVSGWRLSFGWYLLKPAVSFAVLIALLILPMKFYDNYQLLNVLKTKVINVSQAAIGDLFSAKASIEDKDFGEARQNFGQASTNFLNAQQQLEQINDGLFALAKIIPNQTVQLAGNSKNIVNAGQLASEVGDYVTAAIDSLLIETEGKQFTDILSEFSGYGHQALIKADGLNREINQIDSQIVPVEYQREFTALLEQSEFLTTSLRELLDIVDNLQVFLGQSYDRRYLMVFQNNTEMRASGGFMGSFATIDFSQGELKNIQTPKGGIYDVEAGMRVLVQAPKPMQLVNPLWHLWDCNWWSDWPKTANKIMWFYEKSSGPTVDGVISLTPTVLEKLLRVIGPIDMVEDYGVIIDHHNFLMVLQEFSEQKPDVTAEPKEIIGDLLLKIVDELSNNLDREQLINLIGAIDESLEEKHLLLYFTDSDLEQKVNELGWAGQMKETNFDYLQVVNTNIAGGKSDRDMRQKIYLDSTIRPDGSIVNELTIERKHGSIRGEKFTGVRNVNWMRIYVPAGSQLISASGWRQPDEQFFEEPDSDWIIDPDIAEEEASLVIDEATGTNIYMDGGKTVFANWSMLDPGETVIIKLTYKLPFVVEKQAPPEKLWDRLKYLVDPDELYPYSLLTQKQPGSQKTEFYYHLDIQNDLDTVWSYPEFAEPELLTDKYWSYLFNGSNI